MAATLAGAGKESPVGSRLELQFARDENRTHLLVRKQEPPWRVIRAFPNRQGEAVVHLHNVSGGVLSGDSLHLSITALPGARAQVTTVGATRVYRRRSQTAAASLSTEIQVGANALLEYLPDVVIPFSGSQLNQNTHVLLGVNAGLIWWETMSAGRLASGEEFGFESLASATHISSFERPIAFERYLLQPALSDPRSIARWGKFRYSATLYVCHTGVEPRRWMELEARLNDVAFEVTTPFCRWAASTLVANGIVLRGLAGEAHQIGAGLHRFWALAKKELWGEDAIPPRKIN